jgi:hypothetical protein
MIDEKFTSSRSDHNKLARERMRLFRQLIKDAKCPHCDEIVPKSKIAIHLRKHLGFEKKAGAGELVWT